MLMQVMTEIDAANLMGQRAFDIINNQEIKKDLVRAEARVRRNRKVESLIISMQEWIIRKTGMRENMSNEVRNAYMIVATLVATATYQAMLSPPGGFHQIDAAGTNNTVILGDGPSNSSKVYEGKSVMSDTKFLEFSTTNFLAFMTSIFTIILLMPKNVGWFLLYGSILLLTMGYSLSMTVISPNRSSTLVMFLILMAVLPALVLAFSLLYTPRSKSSRRQL